MPFLYHPLVVHFPVALWLTSCLFDLLYARTRERFFAAAAMYLIGLGLLGAAASIIAGFVDYVPLVAEGIGQAFVDRHRVHSLLAYATTVVYAGMFLARWRRQTTPQGLHLAVALAGAALISLTGWFGGEIRRVM